jgi:hypothetical protein
LKGVRENFSVTLISAFNSDGCIGRCDAKCHDAEEPECHCICGGHYHGKRSGSPELREAIERCGDEVLSGLRAKGLHLEIAGEVAQRSLFQ